MILPDNKILSVISFIICAHIAFAQTGSQETNHYSIKSISDYQLVAWKIGGEEVFIPEDSSQNFVLIFYSNPSCSGCMQLLSEYFKHKKIRSNASLYIILNYPADAYTKREFCMYCEEKFPAFHICFDNGQSNSTHQSLFRKFKFKRTPAIVFGEAETQKHYAFSEADIFDESFIKPRFSKKLKKYFKLIVK